MNGHKVSEASRKKISDARKGIQYSKETIRKMSKSHIGKHLSKETKIKLSATHKGKPSNHMGMHWFNNGVENIMAYSCPFGFSSGRLKLKRGEK